jgi:hypothetical protein
LTSGSSLVEFPVWSPDGKQIALRSATVTCVRSWPAPKETRKSCCDLPARDWFEQQLVA